MAVDAHTFELKLVRRADGVELDLLPLQGLWTEEQYLKLTNQTNHQTLAIKMPFGSVLTSW